MNNTDIIVGAIVAFISSIYNFSYWNRHKNGKSSLRLITSGVLLYFAVANFVLYFNFISSYPDGHTTIRTWLPVLYLIPSWDLIIDWKINKSDVNRIKMYIERFVAYSKKALFGNVGGR